MVRWVAELVEEKFNPHPVVVFIQGVCVASSTVRNISGLTPSQDLGKRAYRPAVT